MSTTALLLAAARPAAQLITQQVMPLLLQPVTKKRLFKEFDKQLGYLKVSQEQRRYILRQLEQPACLRQLVTLVNVEEVRLEVLRALEYPTDLPQDDLRMVEAALTTFALIRALRIVTAPDQHHALSADADTLNRIEAFFPGLDVILEGHRKRQQAPLQSSIETITSLLTKTKQDALQVIVSADGVPQFTGRAKVQFKLPDHYREAAAQWVSEPQSERLVLQWQENDMRVTTGDAELDKLLFPQQAFNLHLVLKPVVYDIRLRVRNGTESRVIPAQMALHRRGKDKVLHVGNERMKVEIHSPDDQGKVTIRHSYHTGQLPLPPEDETLLESLLLLLSPGGSAAILSGINPETGHQINVENPQAFLRMPELADHSQYIVPIDIHLTLLKMGQLAVKHGFDPLSLHTPEHLNAEQYQALQAMKEILRGQTSFPDYSLRLTMEVAREVYPQISWKMSKIAHRAVFRLGEAYFIINQPINDIQVIKKRRNKKSLEVDLEGNLGRGHLTVADHAEAERLWASET